MIFGDIQPQVALFAPVHEVCNHGSVLSIIPFTNTSHNRAVIRKHSEEGLLAETSVDFANNKWWNWGLSHMSLSFGECYLYPRISFWFIFFGLAPPQSFWVFEKRIQFHCFEHNSNVSKLLKQFPSIELYRNTERLKRVYTHLKLAGLCAISKLSTLVLKKMHAS